MVGTIEPRKGCKEVFEAFKLMWSSGLNINLVFVGKQGWMMDQFTLELKNTHYFNQQLFWLEGISDEYLEKIYESSTCLIVASYGEGFGLPLIEAAQFNLPIIARDIPVFREVVDENAYFFDASDPLELATVLKKWIELYEGGLHPISSGIHWQTWSQSVNQLLLRIGIT
jgi:glycosyltransferase involved in cell wall biosynthesis